MDIPERIRRSRANSYPTPPDITAIERIKRPVICFEEQKPKDAVIVKDFKIHPSPQ